MSRTGAAHVARFAHVRRSCMAQAPVLLGVVAPPCLAAALLGSWDLAAALAPQTLGLLALSLWRRDAAEPPSFRRIEAIAVFSLTFLIACLISAPPFVVLGMSTLAAMFEATSGITSTGLSVARDAESWPVAAHLLRGWLQWCGGFALAFAGLTLLRARSDQTRHLGQSVFDERDPQTTLRKQAVELLAVYGAITAVAILGCVILLPSWWEGVAIALAAASTGGFTPRADSLASYTTDAQVFIMAICVLAALSFLFYVRLWRDGPRKAFDAAHVLLYLGILLGGILLYLALILAGPDPAALPRLLNFVSALTTAGFSSEPLTGAAPMLLLLVVAMAIGGNSGSTAGGIKIGRIAVAIGMVRLTVERARLPTHGVLHLRDRGARLTGDDISAAGAVLVLYVVTVLTCWGIFLAAGIPALDGLFDVVSAVSTVGLSSGVTGPELSPGLTGVLTVAMLLGRLEFLALIILLLPGTWRRSAASPSPKGK